MELAMRQLVRAGVPALLMTFVAALAACTSGGSPTAAPTQAASAPTTQVMGRGQFHDVDGSASGEVQLVVKPDGAYVLVLESFSIEAIEHTNVVLVKNTDVTATLDVDKAMLLDLGPLKATQGMQDYPIPADMAASLMETYHAAVIWDTEMAHAIAAAPLGP
jgi:hypothetical protein